MQSFLAWRALSYRRWLLHWSPLVRRSPALLLMSLVACAASSRAPAVAPSGTLSVAAPEGDAVLEGPFRVAFAGPTGAAPSSARIQIVFSRPLRALALAGDEAPPPVTISPAVAGRWSWVGTSALIFVPEAATLPFATRVRVTVPAGTAALDGSRLDKPHQFEFETPRPKLVNTMPYEGSEGLEPQQHFELEFNQPVLASEVERALRVTAVRAQNTRKLVAKVSVPDPRSPKRVRVDATGPLPLDSEIRLELSASLRGMQGDLTAQHPRSVSFRTYGPLAVQGVDCMRDVSNQACEPGGSVSLSLTNPVRMKELKAAVRTEPKVALSWDTWQDDDDYTTSVTINGDFRAGSTYTLLVDGALRDRYGQVIRSGTKNQLRIGDYRPRVALGVTGQYLEPTATQTLPVASVNVNRYELYARPVQAPDLLNLMKDPNPELGLVALGRIAKPRVVTSAGPKNTMQRESIALSDLLGKSAGRGVLALGVAYADARGERNRELKFLQVTDLAISAKLSRTQSIVWVTRLSTGAPVAGAQIEVWSDPKQQPKKYTADARGLAQFDARESGSWKQDPTLIVARTGSDWSFRRASEYIDPWRFDVPSDVLGDPRDSGLIFTDRGIYRPGDSVRIKGIVRRQAETGNVPWAGAKLELVVRSPDWEIASKHAVKTSAFGTFSFDLKLPAAAKLGSWGLSVEVSGNQVGASFEVAEYRAAEFKVTTSSDRTSYVRGDTAKLAIQGDYLYGAPMSGAEVRYSVVRSRTRFSVPGAEEWVTDAEAYYSGKDEDSLAAAALRTANGKLDARGRLETTLPLKMEAQRGPELITLDAEVTDVSRQSISGSSTTLVHPSAHYIALTRPEAYFVTAPATVQPKALLVSPAGKRVPGQKIELQLYRRKWVVARTNAGGDLHSETRVVDDLVSTCTVASRSEFSSCDLKLADSGYYIVLASAKDARGNVARAAVDLYALGKGTSYWPESDAKKIELVPDKRQYRVGETARLLVKSPFPEAEALITVESGSVREQRVVHVTGATPTIPIPISEQMRPNAFASVLLIRPRTLPLPKEANQPDVGAPTYRLGYAELRVDPEARRLKVALTPSASDLRPGQELRVDVATKTVDGKPAPAEVTLYAVDEGVLTLTGYKVPDPLEVFTAPRPLAVATLEARDALARIRSLDLASGLGLDKGSDGGGGGDASAARRDFRQTAYYNPAVVTDSTGRASVSFRLPDALTTYRIMAVAVTTDDRYGFGASSVTTSKPIMARPALPRFLRAGDQFQAAVVLSAKGLNTTTAEVKLVQSGGKLLGPAVQSAPLKAGGALVEFPMSVANTGALQLRFEVSAGGQRDAVELTRRIDSPAELEAVALYGRTLDRSAERIAALGGLRRDVGDLQVSVAATALVGLDHAIEQLTSFPYECTEQLASRVLPLLPLRDLARDFGLRVPEGSDAVAAKSLAEIVRRQLSDGGFGMWPESQYSSPWVSPYALWVLHEAKKRGAALPPAVFEQGHGYLRRVLEVAPRDALDAATNSLVLYVLAELGKPDLGYTERSFEARATLPVFARALLLHAMVVGKSPAASIAKLRAELEASLRVEADRAFVLENLGDEYAPLMDSVTRTSALVLRALLAAEPKHPLAAPLAKGLLRARRGGVWRSTQESAFSLLALDAYRRAQERSSPDYDVSAWIGEERVLEHHFGGRTQLARTVSLPVGKLKSGTLTFDKDGEGVLFYEARLRYAREQLPSTTLDRGFYVQKTQRKVDPDNLQVMLAQLPASGQDQFGAGDLVLTDLVVVTPDSRDYVVIDDPLPAGLEAVNTNLATTAAWLRAVDEEPVRDPERDREERARGGVRFASTARSELRDDRALFFVDHMAAGIHQYRYLARATTRGRFLVPVTRAQEMYTPEVFGRTAASVLEVK